MDIAPSSDHSKIIFTKMFVKKSFYTIEGRVDLNKKSIRVRLWSELTKFSRLTTKISHKRKSLRYDFNVFINLKWSLTRRAFYRNKFKLLETSKSQLIQNTAKLLEKIKQISFSGVLNYETFLNLTLSNLTNFLVQFGAIARNKYFSSASKYPIIGHDCHYFTENLPRTKIYVSLVASYNFK